MLPPMWPRPTKPIFVDVAAVISVLPFDRGQVVRSQLEVRCCKGRIDRGRGAEADDGPPSRQGRGGSGPRPPPRRSGVVANGDLAEPVHQLEVLRQLGFPEVVAAPALAGAPRSSPDPVQRRR